MAVFQGNLNRDCPILENPTPDNPILDFPIPDFPTSDNPMQLNKDILNTLSFPFLSVPLTTPPLTENSTTARMEANGLKAAKEKISFGASIGNVKPSTAAAYNKDINKHIKPASRSANKTPSAYGTNIYQ